MTTLYPFSGWLRPYSVAYLCGKLLSRHLIQSPDCLAFIDVSRTAEEKVGTSRQVSHLHQDLSNNVASANIPHCKNPGEIGVIVNLVKHYYRTLNFCVITPYDAQRAAIQRSLENENLPWETVYNLDSFQGLYLALCHAQCC